MGDLKEKTTAHIKTLKEICEVAFGSLARSALEEQLPLSQGVDKTKIGPISSVPASNLTNYIEIFVLVL